MTNERNGEGSTESGGNLNDVALDFRVLFRRFGNFADLLRKLVEAGGAHIKRRGEFRVSGLGDQARGVYGFSIRSGIAEGEPRIEAFGNLHPREDGFIVGDVHEPLVDVLDEGDEIVVRAELPGVFEDEILVRVDGERLTIKTIGERQYSKELWLSAPIAEDSLGMSYGNGLLEVRARKRIAP